MSEAQRIARTLVHKPSYKNWLGLDVNGLPKIWLAGKLYVFPEDDYAIVVRKSWMNKVCQYDAFDANGLLAITQGTAKESGMQMKRELAARGLII